MCRTMPAMKWVDVAGARLAYEDSGRSHGPIILLLNALGTDFGIWDEQRPVLDGSLRLLRFDARGHGKSLIADNGHAGPISLDLLLQDACAVLDAAGVDRAHWCGTSLGGMIALRAAIHAPQRVSRLILANTAAYLPPAEMWQSRVDTVLRDGMEPVAVAAAARWFTPEFIHDQPARVETVTSMVRATRPADYAGCCAAIQTMDQRASLPALRLPTLVIAGARDQGTPVEYAEQLVSQIAGSDLLVLDASHLACIEQAEDFSTAVVDFLRT